MTPIFYIIFWKIGQTHTRWAEMKHWLSRTRNSLLWRQEKQRKQQCKSAQVELRGRQRESKALSRNRLWPDPARGDCHVEPPMRSHGYRSCTPTQRNGSAAFSLSLTLSLCPSLSTGCNQFRPNVRANEIKPYRRRSSMNRETLCPFDWPAPSMKHEDRTMNSMKIET